MNRNERAQQGQETVAILEKGEYEAPSGQLVSIRDALERAVEGTQLYLPEQELPRALDGKFQTKIIVENRTTLSAAHKLVRAGGCVLALNFASAKNPGGGFLSGAEAQEESLARASGLYACVKNSPYYAHHRASGDLFYSHRAIYSPDVPVFRDDSGALLEQPWLCSFLTCPAVNKGALIQNGSTQLHEVVEVMRQRIERVLGIARARQYECLVLGAFGCGVFQNDPLEVATLFRDALSGSFRGAFRQVTFAVLDKPEGPRITAFQQVFAEL